jgi:hypothetical protein
LPIEEVGIQLGQNAFGEEEEGCGGQKDERKGRRQIGLKEHSNGGAEIDGYGILNGEGKSEKQ